MQSRIAKSIAYPMSFLACAVLALTTGCASGGFKLTREYARFVNKQQLIIRIILYILTAVVFAVTLLVDMVIFNTMDFWQGRVAQGNYEFNQDGKTFLVHHEISPETSLKSSTIRVVDENKKTIQVVQLRETMDSQIEMFVNGQLRAKVRDISSIPVASVYDANGVFVKDTFPLFEMPVTSSLLIASTGK